MQMRILRRNSSTHSIVSRRDDLQAALKAEILCVGRMAVLQRSIWCRREVTCMDIVIEAMHSSRRALGFRCSTPPSQRASERMATLLLPVAVQLFSEKPAAPPPAAGFFVCGRGRARSKSISTVADAVKTPIDLHALGVARAMVRRGLYLLDASVGASRQSALLPDPDQDAKIAGILHRYGIAEKR